MKNNTNYKYYLKIISQIENIRKKNNNSWMNILRLSFKNSPVQSAKLMSQIYVDDQKISQLVKKLSKKNQIIFFNFSALFQSSKVLISQNL